MQGKRAKTRPKEGRILTRRVFVSFFFSSPTGLAMSSLGPPPRSTRLYLLLRAVRHRRRRWLHAQKSLAELHMMGIFFLRVKLGRVAEGGRSILSSISLRSTVAPHTCYMGLAGRPYRPHNRFLLPHFTVR